MSPSSPIVPQSIPPNNTATSPLKSKIHNTLRKTKRMFFFGPKS